MAHEIDTNWTSTSVAWDARAPFGRLEGFLGELGILPIAVPLVWQIGAGLLLSGTAIAAAAGLNRYGDFQSLEHDLAEPNAWLTKSNQLNNMANEVKQALQSSACYKNPQRTPRQDLFVSQVEHELEGWRLYYTSRFPVAQIRKEESEQVLNVLDRTRMDRVDAQFLLEQNLRFINLAKRIADECNGDDLIATVFEENSQIGNAVKTKLNEIEEKGGLDKFIGVLTKSTSDVFWKGTLLIGALAAGVILWKSRSAIEAGAEYSAQRIRSRSLSGLAGPPVLSYAQSKQRMTTLRKRGCRAGYRVQAGRIVAWRKCPS